LEGREGFTEEVGFERWPRFRLLGMKVELIRHGLRLRRLDLCGKNSGEKGAAHEDFWKSVEGVSKLWPLICTQLG